MANSGSFKVSPGSAAGRFGEAFGKGLGEAVPKEIERYRLSQGLQNFAKNAPNLSPLEAYAQASAIPGITPQMIQALPELLRIQQERQNAVNQGGQGSAEQTGQIQGGAEQPAKPNQMPNTRENIFNFADKLPLNHQGITTQGPIQAALSDIREPTQQEIFSKRAEILKQNPWMSVPAATAQAEDFYARENRQKTAQIEKGQRQEQLQAKVDQEFEKEFNLLTKKTKEAYSGEAFQDMRDAAREDVASGLLTPSQAAKKYGKLALSIEENFNRLKQMADTPYITQKATVVRDNIDRGSATWKEAGRSKEYSNHLQGQFGVSPEMGNYLAYPPEKDKAMNSVVSSYKPARPIGLVGLPNRDEVSAKSVDAAKKLAQTNFDKNLSIKSLIVALKNKDQYFDDAAFQDELDRLYNAGELKLNADQRNELTNRQTSWIPNLNDWYMKIAGGWK